MLRAKNEGPQVTARDPSILFAYAYRARLGT